MRVSHNNQRVRVRTEFTPGAAVADAAAGNSCFALETSDLHSRREFQMFARVHIPMRARRITRKGRREEYVISEPIFGWKFHRGLGGEREDTLVGTLFTFEGFLTRMT